MIKPNKHMNLNVSTIRVSSLIILLLIKNNIVEFDEALSYITKELGDNSRFVFISALNLLYLLDKITYHPQTNTIELINESGLK